MVPSYGSGQELVVAVADGHGSRDSFRSDVGARFAAGIAAEQAFRLVANADLAAADLETAAPDLAESVVRAWTDRVLDHLSATPVGDDELLDSPRGRDGHEDDPLRAYGSTLLLAVLTERAALALQLGDGDIIAIDAEGRTLSPIPVDPSLVANETTSLCLPHAERFVRWAVFDLEASPTVLFVLASDGYGNSFADASWRHDVSTDLARLIAARGLDWVQQELAGWLAESAEVGGDDVTVALVSCIDTKLVPAPAHLTDDSETTEVDPVPAGDVTQRSDHSPSRTRSRRRR